MGCNLIYPRCNTGASSTQISKASAVDRLSSTFHWYYYFRRCRHSRSYPILFTITHYICYHESHECSDSKQTKNNHTRQQIGTSLISFSLCKLAFFAEYNFVLITLQKKKIEHQHACILIGEKLKKKNTYHADHWLASLFFTVFSYLITTHHTLSIETMLKFEEIFLK